MLDQRLRNLLVCPQDRGPLLLVAAEGSRDGRGSDELLYNPRLRRAYRIEDGVPVLLISEAVTVGDDVEHHSLVARAQP